MGAFQLFAKNLPIHLTIKDCSSPPPEAPQQLVIKKSLKGWVLAGAKI